MPPPLFLFAIAFFIGLSSHFGFPLTSALCLVPFLFFFEKRTLTLLFACLGCLHGALFLPTEALPTTPLEGKAVFVLQSIGKAQTPFHTSIALKGVCRSFQTSDKTYTSLPVTVFVQKLPDTGSKWEIEGTLDPSGTLKPKKKQAWKELDAPFSWARWRYTQKKQVEQFIRSKWKNKKVAQFFTAMSTGEKPDWRTTMEFRKVGLSHILSISGFHFALIALLIGSILNRFLSPQISAIASIGCLTFLLLFLGLAPSILRAYVMIALYLLGKLARRRVDGLNLLGAALLIELLFNPGSVTDLGCQLSYLATFGIITFYSLFQGALQKLFPKRPPSLLLSMPRLDQHGYLCVRATTSALALQFAVQLTTLPLLLYTFETFPLLGIPYNLVLTPLLGAALLLFPFALFLPPLRFLLSKFTALLLHLIASPPTRWELSLPAPPLPLPLVCLLLTLIAIWGLKKRDSFRENRTFLGHGGRSSVG